MMRSIGILVLGCLLALPAAGATIRFGGVDAQSQYTGFSGPPGPDTPGVFTFNDTVNGANPGPEPGTVTTEENIAGLVGGRINLELFLDTSSYDPATDSLLDARFVGTGPTPEITIWDAGQTTLLLSFDVQFVDVVSASPFGGGALSLGDSPRGDPPQAVNSSLLVSGGSLAGAVGGIGTEAVLQLILSRPNPALPIAGFPFFNGYLNDSLTVGITTNPLSAVNWDIAIVPEPDTGILVGASLVVLGLLRRERLRRRR
ncbi:MAG: hypothetical protein MJE66_04000 [Proteobacteria bacterium]|nr:hypothetical protein [Pseudomonadota bacterium]